MAPKHLKPRRPDLKSAIASLDATVDRLNPHRALAQWRIDTAVRIIRPVSSPGSKPASKPAAANETPRGRR